MSIIESSHNCGVVHDNAMNVLCSNKYIDAVHILENDGCIECVYPYGDNYRPTLITLTHKRFSGYYLERHDVWVNRFWGFVSGLVVGVISTLIVNALL